MYSLLRTRIHLIIRQWLWMEDFYPKKLDFQMDYSSQSDFILPFFYNFGSFLANLTHFSDPNCSSKICSRILLTVYNCTVVENFLGCMSQVRHLRGIWLPIIFFPLPETSKKLPWLWMLLQCDNGQGQQYLLFPLDKLNLEVSWVKVHVLHQEGSTLILVVSVSVDVGGNGWNRLVLINIYYIF